MTAVPAAFMSAVSLTYILMAEEGLRMSSSFAYPAGVAFAVTLLTAFTLKLFRAVHSS